MIQVVLKHPLKLGRRDEDLLRYFRGKQMVGACPSVVISPFKPWFTHRQRIFVQVRSMERVTSFWIFHKTFLDRRLVETRE